MIALFQYRMLEYLSYPIKTYSVYLERKVGTAPTSLHWMCSGFLLTLLPPILLLVLRVHLNQNSNLLYKYTKNILNIQIFSYFFLFYFIYFFLILLKPYPHSNKYGCYTKETSGLQRIF